jgi:hypothetical protein
MKSDGGALLLLRSARLSMLAPHLAVFLPIVCSMRAAAAYETTGGNLEERQPTSLQSLPRAFKGEPGLLAHTRRSL